MRNSLVATTEAAKLSSVILRYRSAPRRSTGCRIRLKRPLTPACTSLQFHTKPFYA